MTIKNDIFLMDKHGFAMIFECITFILAFLIAIAVFRKWRKRKIKATLYLSISLFSISFAALAVFTGLFSWFISWILLDFSSINSPLYYQISLPLGYLFVIPYDIFLFLFTIHIFSNKNEKRVIPILIIGIFLGIILFLPTNYWGLDPQPGIDLPSTRTLIMISFLLYNMIIYVLLAIYAFKESKKTEDIIHKRGFQAIGLGQITNLLVFILFTVDSILILLNPGSPGYSIFIDLGWITAVIATFLFYIGYIMPSWFKKIIKKE